LRAFRDIHEIGMFERQSAGSGFIAVTGDAIRIQHRSWFCLALLGDGWPEGQCG